MRIVIEPEVHWVIDDFYEAALARYKHTLSEDTVERKKRRLYEGIRSLKDYYAIFHKASRRQKWIEYDWQEFICEDFHFAYEVLVDKDGSDMIIIRDAVHSLLNY